jgi:tRNA (mo5U34)-methyltransferase
MVAFAADQRKKLAHGITAYENGDLEQGLDLIEQASLRSPGSLPLLNLKGRSPILKVIYQQKPDNMTILHALAEALFIEGHQQEAQKYFIQIIKQLRGRDSLLCENQSVTEEKIRQQVGNQPIWHSIDIGEDLFIEGQRKTSRVLAREMLRMQFPDITGKTVLDIGAFGGWFSFEMERRGAKSVTALDYFSWAINFQKLHEWISKERAAGGVPNPYKPPANVIDVVNQPGRIVFDITKDILSSSVKPVCAIFEDINENELGVFDVVLHLGVLYHLENPFLSLKKIGRITKEIAIIETLGFVYPDMPERPVWEFFNDSRVNKDVTTWWAPSEKGLSDMLYACGFKSVDILYGADTILPFRNNNPQLCRIIAHARK